MGEDEKTRVEDEGGLISYRVGLLELARTRDNSPKD
jgi:hypothetical protein